MTDNNLYAGIFWVKDQVPSDDLCFQVPVDTNGNPEGYIPILNAKSKKTFNHEKTWNYLPSRITDNKSFDYYPRGRVVITNNKATIYANPNICTDSLKTWCISKFNLNKHNGIKKVDMKPDYSEHYKCYLDKEVL